VKPLNVSTSLELSDVSAKAFVEYSARKNIALRQNENRQTKRIKQRAFVMIEFGRQQNLFPIRISKSPTRHPKYRGTRTSARDLIGIARMPRSSGSEPGLSARVCENLGHIT
jgi:hypothetical protein